MYVWLVGWEEQAVGFECAPSLLLLLLMMMMMQVSYPLLTLNTGMVEAGQFTIPFRFQLPSQLPQSFQASGPGWNASVVYKIKVTLVGGDNGSGSQSRYFNKSKMQEVEPGCSGN